MSERDPRAGVPYEVADEVWATPVVAPPGPRRRPLAEVHQMHGCRIVWCGPTGYEWDLYAVGVRLEDGDLILDEDADPVLGRDLDLTGQAAAQTFVAVVTWDTWSRYRFERYDPQVEDIRMVPLFACWIDPLATAQRQEAQGA